MSNFLWTKALASATRARYTRFKRSLLKKKEAVEAGVDATMDEQCLDCETSLQLGTRGLFQGESFTLVGRLHWHWQEGSWNSWCAQFNKNRLGWLVEEQDFYMLSFALEDDTPLPDPVHLRLGDMIDLKRKGLFTVDDCKRALCVASEGALPFPIPSYEEMLSIDASDSKGQFLSLEKASRGLRALLGRALAFADFQFQNPRA